MIASVWQKIKELLRKVMLFLLYNITHARTIHDELFRPTENVYLNVYDEVYTHDE